MAAKRPDARSIFYFPERLKKKLAQISSYPATVVEAPSGFGKTTAVREYLKENIPRNACERWHTCLGEPPSKAWEGICGLFAVVSRDAAEALKQLGPPTMDTLADVASVMREVRAPAETYLVVDNYQLFENEMPREAIDAFSVHGDKKLRVIFITQSLPGSKQSVHNANIHRLDKRDFYFDRDSTARLCRLFGIKLSEKELGYIYEASEGWVAAIRLQAANYRETGSFARMSDMNSLIETAVWNKTSGQGRDFLMSVSLLDGFSPRQAAIMLDAPSLPKSAEGLLRDNAFIPYFEERGAYYMHALLRDFLKARFESAPNDFRSETLRRAGIACEAVGEYFDAARFFIEVRDYDAILSMPFTAQYFFNHKGKNIIEFFERLIDECREEILLTYPIVLLTIGYLFFRNGIREKFARIVEMIQRLTSDPSELPEHELSRVRGELAMLMSFPQFNDIAKMSEYHRKAFDYLKRGSASPKSVIFFGNMSWTLGTASVLCLYWRTSGELEKTLSVMDECLPIYSGLASGHGTGANSVLRAEASLNRGDDAEAEVKCYKALYEARGMNQIGNCLCAELVLARVAILRGDAQAYGSVRQSIIKDAKEARQIYISRMGELCLALVDSLVERTSDLPDWLRDVKGIRNVLYAHGQPYALTLHSMTLFLEGRRAELYGIAEYVMDTARAVNYLLPQIYQLILLAAAKRADGFEKEAGDYLKDALALALPDRVYLPFAEYGSHILPVIEKIREEKDSGREQMDALIALCRRQIAGVEALRKALAGEKAVLTPRQREIALLTRERLSAKEIADKLFITENTVKSAQRIIYDKLGVHSKSQLSKMEL
jgi:LuxR family maltose regulon positive regulatory protein